ncbi:hypothetical protein GCM10020258_07480 [Sphingomonas yabuuchiae]
MTDIPPTESLRDRAVRIYDAFTHEHHDRRTLLRQMTALAGSVAAAEALILGISASPAAAAQTDPVISGCVSTVARGWRRVRARPPISPVPRA